MRVLVTRPAAEAEETRIALAARGHDAVVEPLLRIEPRAAVSPPRRFDGVLATSANAFAALRHPVLASARGLPLAVAGRRTAEAARDAGFVAEIVAPDGERLAEAVLARWPAPRRLLWPAGSDRAVDLETLLAPAGHHVELVVVYEAVQARDLGGAARQALAAGTVDAALHFSARAAATLVALCTPADLTRMRHVCLSTRVAEPLVRAGLSVEIAATPDGAALLDRLDGSSGGQQS